MSLSNILPVILETILSRLSLLFLAGAQGDIQAARHAALAMLAEYDPQTDAELRLAAGAISFNLHMLEALGQASTPEMPLNKVMRLRGAAVSLSREAHRAEQRLDKLRAARREAEPPTQAATLTQPQAPTPTSAEDIAAESPTPQAEKAIAVVEETRPGIQAAPNQPPVWSKDYVRFQNARRIAETFRKNQAAHNAASTSPSA